jgi:hypothetical protein
MGQGTLSHRGLCPTGDSVPQGTLSPVIPLAYGTKVVH